MTGPSGVTSFLGILILATAVLPSRGYAQSDCLRDPELKLLGIAVGDLRRIVRKRVGTAVTVRKDTVAGIDFVFDVTRYRTSRMEIVVSDVTGRVAELIPRDSSLALPRGLRFGMSLADVRRRLGPASPDRVSKGALTVMGCGPRGSGMDLRFDETSRLTWASLTGYYPAGS
jgi:hypothetical protein